eukprot:TRINITY_DN5017_c1_g1_i1.p1 TRINITY_DN5017_c1_g1~~TRINITY_DN5017_c1_g1_i1.p1  ORF type:complete len:338 (-),score=29.88 TRINITY_DN5017_c1_g1_i1:233-1246(-)
MTSLNSLLGRYPILLQLHIFMEVPVVHGMMQGLDQETPSRRRYKVRSLNGAPILRTDDALLRNKLSETYSDETVVEVGWDNEDTKSIIFIHSNLPIDALNEAIKKENLTLELCSMEPNIHITEPQAYSVKCPDSFGRKDIEAELATAQIETAGWHNTRTFFSSNLIDAQFPNLTLTRLGTVNHPRCDKFHEPSLSWEHHEPDVSVMEEINLLQVGCLAHLTRHNPKIHYVLECDALPEIATGIFAASKDSIMQAHPLIVSWKVLDHCSTAIPRSSVQRIVGHQGVIFNCDMEPLGHQLVIQRHQLQENGVYTIHKGGKEIFEVSIEHDIARLFHPAW